MISLALQRYSWVLMVGKIARFSYILPQQSCAENFHPCSNRSMPFTYSHRIHFLKLKNSSLSQWKGMVKVLHRLWKQDGLQKYDLNYLPLCGISIFILVCFLIFCLVDLWYSICTPKCMMVTSLLFLFVAVTFFKRNNIFARSVKWPHNLMVKPVHQCTSIHMSEPAVYISKFWYKIWLPSWDLFLGACTSPHIIFEKWRKLNLNVK